MRPSHTDGSASSPNEDAITDGEYGGRYNLSKDNRGKNALNDQ